MLKTEAEGRGFQHLPRDLANMDALKNHVQSLFLHKTENIRYMPRFFLHYFVSPADVAAELAEIHEKFVVVPADKASNNILFVCKTHYINCLMEELGMSTMTGNPTYNHTAMSKDESLQNQHLVMLTFGISLPEKDIDLAKLYWIPKLYKNPYKKRYIACSAKCSTKPLSQILTQIITAV